jgi:predicted flap endonuclease-1-like 5' DNA nuclease
MGLTFACSSALAGHYRIADVPDVIPAKYHKKLAKAGVTDTAQLYALAAPSKTRRKLASKARISARKLRAWARFLDLMQINGIGPKMVHLLNAAGVNDLKQLQQANATELQEKMRLANRGARYSEIVPGAAVVKGWIKLAQRVTSRLEG